MRVRIIKHLPAQLEGFDLKRYELDHIYDIPGSLADLLVASALAAPEDGPSPGWSRAIKALGKAKLGADTRPEK